MSTHANDWKCHDPSFIFGRTNTNIHVLMWEPLVFNSHIICCFRALWCCRDNQSITQSKMNLAYAKPAPKYSVNLKINVPSVAGPLCPTENLVPPNGEKRIRDRKTLEKTPRHTWHNHKNNATNVNNTTQLSNIKHITLLYGKLRQCSLVFFAGF